MLECLFRAFRAKAGLPFTSDHRLDVLAEQGGFPDLIPAADRERYDAAIGRLVATWENKHRFRSRAAIERFLKSRKLDRKIKGEYVKENARRSVESPLTVFNLGASAWDRRRRRR